MQHVTSVFTQKPDLNKKKKKENKFLSLGELVFNNY